MDCTKIEPWLSGYIESGLPADEMDLVKKHLTGCRNCSALLDAMQAVITASGCFPAYDMDPGLLEKILFRTSGRLRRLSFRERFHQYILGPPLTPRLIAGISLATMFMAFTTYLLAPRAPAILSALSPEGLLQSMDRGVQQLYGEGLKAYYKNKDLQAQLKYFTDSSLNKLRFMIDRIDILEETQKKYDDPLREEESSL
jgi:hypothetical protein